MTLRTRAAAFWAVMSCSLVETYQLSDVLAALTIRVISDSPITLMMEAADKTTCHYNPEDSHALPVILYTDCATDKKCNCFKS